MEGSTRPPQISAMFSQFALSFKAKAFEFFSEDNSSAVNGRSQTLALNSSEDFRPDQKIVITKPDPPPPSPPTSPPPPPSPPMSTSNLRRTSNFQFNQTLISSLFATVSSFEASYLQLQTAHVPFDEEAITVADKALVSHLQTLSEFKQLYKSYYHNPNFCVEFSTGSCLEFQVNENQSKLRALKSVFNRLQSEIDVKDDEVSALRRTLEELETANSKLSGKMFDHTSGRCADILLTVRVFDAFLRDACRMARDFTKLLINFMDKSGWDVHLAADSVYDGVNYAKKGHYRYSLFSYICLGMLQMFDSEDFGLAKYDDDDDDNNNNDDGTCNGCTADDKASSSNSLTQLIEHVCWDPLELLSKSPDCEFSRFCEERYRQLIHPTMESSIFSQLDQKGEVVNSWKSLNMFYGLFVKMASSIWILHKLAFSFDPPVSIFQVDRGVDFSTVYMEDITGKCKSPCQRRPNVAFTVVPGFKIGETIIQSKVYLSQRTECTK